MSDEAAPARTRRRPRLSLLNALLLTTIVALSVAVWRQHVELARLRAENKQLNEERGTLVIADRTQVSAIRVPTRFAGYPGTYRVFIPKGTQYVAYVILNDVPKSGLPTIEPDTGRGSVLGQRGSHGPAFATLKPGEHQVSLSVQNRGSGKSFVRFAANGLDVTVHNAKGAWPEAQPETYAVFGNGVPRTTTSVEAGEPLVLFRHRLQAVSRTSLYRSYTTPEPDYPLDGMMLWLEPVKETSDE